MNDLNHVADPSTVPGSAMSTAEIKARIDAMFADDHGSTVTGDDRRATAASPRRPGWASSRRGRRS